MIVIYINIYIYIYIYIYISILNSEFGIIKEFLSDSGVFCLFIARWK